MVVFSEIIDSKVDDHEETRKGLESIYQPNKKIHHINFDQIGQHEQHFLERAQIERINAVVDIEDILN